jgi:hypothetical protein
MLRKRSTAGVAPAQPRAVKGSVDERRYRHAASEEEPVRLEGSLGRAK